MNTFNSLTKKQQNKAIALAKIEMRECVELGLLTFGRMPTDLMLTKWATMAAEGSSYDIFGNAVMEK